MEYYKQLNAQKFNNSDRMDQFLENHKAQKLLQGEIGNLDGPCFGLN